MAQQEVGRTGMQEPRLGDLTQDCKGKDFKIQGGKKMYGVDILHQPGLWKAHPLRGWLVPLPAVLPVLCAALVKRRRISGLSITDSVYVYNEQPVSVLSMSVHTTGLGTDFFPGRGVTTWPLLGTPLRIPDP